MSSSLDHLDVVTRLDRVGDAVGRVLASVTTALLVLGVGLVLGGVVLPSAPVPPAPRFVALDPGQPVRLQVRALQIDAPVVPIQVSSDAVLDPPADPVQVGWWDRSALPGAEAGQTVITGHTVHTGGGALDRVGELEPGAKVDVVTAEGRMRYRITEVREYERDEVAAQALDLFGQDRSTERLVLVTCTDWDGTAYERNVIAFGEPLGQPRGQAQASDEEEPADVSAAG